MSSLKNILYQVKQIISLKLWQQRIQFTYVVIFLQMFLKGWNFLFVSISKYTSHCYNNVH